MKKLAEKSQKKMICQVKAEIILDFFEMFVQIYLALLFHNWIIDQKQLPCQKNYSPNYLGEYQTQSALMDINKWDPKS